MFNRTSGTKLPDANTVACYYTVLVCTGGFYTPRLTKREDTVSNMYFADLEAIRLHIDPTLAGTVGGKVCYVGTDALTDGCACLCEILRRYAGLTSCQCATLLFS